MTVLDGAGNFLGRADLAYVDCGVLIEFDGLAKYGDIPDGPDARTALIEEKRRADRLRAAGFIVLRLVWSDLGDRERLRRLLSDAMEQRRRAVAAGMVTGTARGHEGAWSPGIGVSFFGPGSVSLPVLAFQATLAIITVALALALALASPRLRRGPARMLAQLSPLAKRDVSAGEMCLTLVKLRQRGRQFASVGRWTGECVRPDRGPPDRGGPVAAPGYLLSRRGSRRCPERIPGA